MQKISMDVALNLILLAVFGLAAFYDVKERRIPNWVIIVGVIGGVVLAGLQGSTQVLISIAGFLAGILVLLIPFALGWMGAGDVKLFAVVGSLLGYSGLPRVFFYSCLGAGSMALLAVALGYTRQVSLKSFWTDCKFMFLTLPMRLRKSKTFESRAVDYRVPWGVAIGAGTIMACYIDSAGTWAGF